MNDINLNEVKTTEITKKMFPKKCFRWYIPMPMGRLAFLELIVDKKENKTPITKGELLEIYKNRVCRGEFNEKNFRPWLLRTIGALVFDVFLIITATIRKELIEELKNIQEQNKLLKETQCPIKA